MSEEGLWDWWGQIVTPADAITLLTTLHPLSPNYTLAAFCQLTRLLFLHSSSVSSSLGGRPMYFWLLLRVLYLLSKCGQMNLNISGSIIVSILFPFFQIEGEIASPWTSLDPLKYIWLILMNGTLTNKCSSGCPYIPKRIASILEKSSESHCKITQLTKIKHEKLCLCSSRKLGHSPQQFKVRDKSTDFHFPGTPSRALGWSDSHSVHTVFF